ncbi:MAG TPA: glycosyl hydrolase family 65 protein, partial [Anaerolineales bacterium]|nr:glycosyl hydrolase family 65 protein [Anaerolineales bacterium]
MDTARIWLGLGRFVDRLGGRFGIYEVTGPDEYTACVNNNYYTNAMAQMHLAFAADVAERLRRDHPADFARIVAAIGLGPDEPAAWRAAAEAMYLPVDEVLGIHPQDDSFLEKPAWDIAQTPAENFPLLLHYHPLVIYRHRVLKQADVVLALLLLGDRFTLEEKKRDYDYYEPLTTHDSSLSSCIYSILASEIGYHDQAYAFFMETARMDLDNKHGNTPYGAHLAAMAGAWLSLVYGFAGLRAFNGTLRFAPYLPGHWSHYRFMVRAQGRQLEINVDGSGVTYRLRSGEALTVLHHDRAVMLTAEQPETFIAD